jgi:hypothetical protein
MAVLEPDTFVWVDPAHTLVANKIAKREINIFFINHRPPWGVRLQI